MSTSLIYKIDDVLRAALWEAHGKLCPYDGERIATIEDMEVDHILPKSLWQDREKLRPMLKSLGLEENYSADSLDNLLPVRRTRNRRKGKWIFRKQTVRYFRELASQRIDQVIAIHRRLKREAKHASTYARVTALCAAEPLLRRRLQTALAATPDFPRTDQVNNESFVFARSRVRLEGQLPSQHGHGSVTLRINSLYLHTVDFAFECKDVLQELLPGWGTPFDLLQRPFIVKRANGPDEWAVRLNGTTALLTTTEVGQLCELVDLMTPHFLRMLWTREIQDGTLQFEPDGPRNVRLVRLKRALWREIQKFAQTRDFADGNTPWHIFDVAGWGHFKLVDRRSDSVVPFLTYVYASSPEREFASPLCNPEDEAFLCWEEDLSWLGHGPKPKERGWTATETFRWITEKLIPVVIGQGVHALRECRLENTARRDPQYYSASICEAYSIFEFSPTLQGLNLFAEAAQGHAITHHSTPVQRFTIESALAGLQLLADTLPVPDELLPYIAGKIGARLRSTVPAAVRSGALRLRRKRAFTLSDVDHILRCALAILRPYAHGSPIAVNRTTEVMTKWAPLIEAIRLDAIRCRTIYRFEQPEYR